MHRNPDQYTIISHVHRAYNYTGPFRFSGYIWLDNKIAFKKVVGISCPTCAMCIYGNGHHHHHLFLKRPFLPRSARVRCLPRTSLNTAHSGCKPSLCSSVSSFTHSLHVFLPLPPPHFYRPTPNHLCSYVPHAQTTSIYHASPLLPRSEHPKDCTSPHLIQCTMLIMGSIKNEPINKSWFLLYIKSNITIIIKQFHYVQNYNPKTFEQLTTSQSSNNSLRISIIRCF